MSVSEVIGIIVGWSCVSVLLACAWGVMTKNRRERMRAARSHAARSIEAERYGHKMRYDAFIARGLPPWKRPGY